MTQTKYYTNTIHCRLIFNKILKKTIIIQVIDLLNPGTLRKPLDVRWSRKARNFYVDNLFMVDCEELDDLQAVLEEGNMYRLQSTSIINIKKIFIVFQMQ